VQQFATGVCTQVCVVWLHVSVVHGLLSLHCASVVQQFATGVCTQTLFSHVSVVQASLSLHSASLWQQPGIGVEAQPVAGSQELIVHGSLSSHTIGVKTHVFVAWSQVSVVHAFMSSQSASFWQQPGTPLLTQTLFSQVFVVHGLPSWHSASLWQQPGIGVEAQPVAG
jgi:hypothetical protein